MLLSGLVLLAQLPCLADLGPSPKRGSWTSCTFAPGSHLQVATGHGSKPMVPFWGFRCTHFRTYSSGWIGMFTGGYDLAFDPLAFCRVLRPGLFPPAEAKRGLSGLRRAQGLELHQVHQPI